MIVQRAEEVVSKKIGSAWIILESNKKYIRHLNASAGYLWSLVKSPITVSELSKKLAKKYSIDLKTAEKDVLEFVKLYLEKRLLRKVL